MWQRAFIVLLLSLSWMSLPSAATVTEAAQPLRQVTLTVKNMSCAMCKYTVENALRQVEGVKSAKVDSLKGTAVVVFDPARVTPERLAQAVSDAGYPAAVKP